MVCEGHFGNKDSVIKCLGANQAFLSAAYEEMWESGEVGTEKRIRVRRNLGKESSGYEIMGEEYILERHAPFLSLLLACHLGDAKRGSEASESYDFRTVSPLSKMQPAGTAGVVGLMKKEKFFRLEWYCYRY